MEYIKPHIILQNTQKVGTPQELKDYRILYPIPAIHTCIESDSTIVENLGFRYEVDFKKLDMKTYCIVFINNYTIHNIKNR